MVRRRPHSQSWIAFSNAALALSLTASAVGLWQAPLDLWAKGFLGMAELLALFTAVNLAKTKRDLEEFDDTALREADGQSSAYPAARM